MGQVISAFVLVAFVGAALAFDTIEHTNEIQRKVQECQRFYDQYLGIDLPDNYLRILNQAYSPHQQSGAACVQVDVDNFDTLSQRLDQTGLLARAELANARTTDMILLRDPNGILVEVRPK